MKDNIDLKKLGGNYQQLYESHRDKKNITAFGLPFSNKSVIVQGLSGVVLLVVANPNVAGQYAEQLNAITADSAVVFNAKDDVLLYKKAVSYHNTLNRLNALYKIATNKVKIVIATIDALLQPVPFKQDIANILRFTVGKEYNLQEISKLLVKLGYKRVDLVKSPAEYALRGDILDVYAINYEQPLRLEFFGDELESCRFFDAPTQLTSSKTDSVDIISATDIFLTENNSKDLLYAMRSCANKVIDEKVKRRTLEIIDDITIAIDGGVIDYSNTWISCFTKSGSNSLLNYFDSEATIVFDEPKQILDKITLIEKEHRMRFTALLSSGEVTAMHINQLITNEQFFGEAKKFRLITTQNITTSNNIFNPDAVYSFREKQIYDYTRQRNELFDDIKSWVMGGFRVILCIKDENWREKYCEYLGDNDISASIVAADNITSGVSIIESDLPQGFTLFDAKIAVIGNKNLITKTQTKTIKRQNKADVFFDLKAGDYVVHSIHGIGICRGVKQIDVQGVKKDYVVVEYFGGDMLYVPLDQMTELNKYSGGETAKLSKLGGGEFERVKARVKASIKELAIDLFDLYSQRSKRQGYCYSSDNALQTEFEQAFEFEETPDQLRCVEEIKQDMQSAKVMDRLLLGDVGFGKTEVALRAIFKAVLDGKQACFLCPTTILSRQHYNTMLNRFCGMGVRVEVLNRFRSEKEIADVLLRLKNGEVDVVCGTHRLLSNDVQFNDLGLLVVDEEQRFGVVHKEKIKALKKDIDVLSMSATPIPRTLHMSLTGIRDISIIETPPQQRLPVQSYVIEQTDGVLTDSIMRELNRGGQVFVLYNRIDSIYSFAEKLIKLTGASIRVAHAKMPTRQLEDTIISFYNGEFSVLVCTTIIENGIDLPNANTLIVIDADMFGLSQLYQLRGRVGRSDRLASAYFLYREGKVFTQSAYKRLNSIMEYSELGSGFKIAMRDLEIRGAGDVLGREQHGSLTKIGYDMYVKLLNECVDELKGINYKTVDTEMVVELNAYIPESYVAEESKRIRLYQDMAKVWTDEACAEYLNMLEDIFGQVPEAVDNIMRINIVKNMASKLGITKVVITSKQTEVELESLKVLQYTNILSTLSRFKGEHKIGGEIKPVISFNLKGIPVNNRLELLKQFFMKTLEKSS